MQPKELKINDDALLHIIRHYTREAGVRNLERSIAKISRKVTRQVITEKPKLPVRVTPKNLDEYLGVRRYEYGKTENEDRVGQVNGLAWTSVGGELLPIEAAMVQGKGKQTYTGTLGDVMQESIQAAITVVKFRAAALGIEAELFSLNDFHIHVPDGATPKDGPSAGVGMCMALISAASNNPVRADVAMTGEITLRGEVLQIGGLKEKLLAAHRGSIKTVIIPKENEKDLIEIADQVKDELNIVPVKWIDEVFELVLANPILPLADEGISAKIDKSSRSKENNQKSAHH